jgi:hypothetical protein
MGWRGREFALFRGIDADSKEIEPAMRQHQDVVEVRPGWFSLRSDRPANAQAILLHDPSAITRAKAVDLLLDQLSEFEPYYQVETCRCAVRLIAAPALDVG